MPMPMLFKSSMSAQPRMLLTKMATQQLPINTVFNASLPANFRVFGCPTFFKRYEPTFRNKLITYKQQLQRASRGIFLGFPDNSAGWLIYSPDQPQSLIITRDAYFDEDFNSALCFDSKPFAGAVPIRSHFNPHGLRDTPENSEPSTYHQTGSAANLGNPPSTFIDTSNHHSSLPAIPETDNAHEDDPPPSPLAAIKHTTPPHGPTPPTPHQINFVTHQQHHSQLHKMMTIYFKNAMKIYQLLIPFTLP
ncbi:hypothetical protein MHU86_17579 [Fragilaria crotonensis]|nr:hypothetical protein MHU86_17579 [Fragilaria crotonensis]